MPRAAQVQTPSALDRRYNEVVAMLTKPVEQGGLGVAQDDPNLHGTYIPMLDLAKNHANNATEFEPLAQLVIQHINTKKEIMDANISRDVKGQLMRDLEGVWNELGARLGEGGTPSGDDPLEVAGMYTALIERKNAAPMALDETTPVRTAPEEVTTAPPASEAEVIETPQQILEEAQPMVTEAQGTGLSLHAYRISGRDGVMFELRRQRRDADGNLLEGQYENPIALGLAPDVLNFLRQFSQGELELQSVNILGNNYEIVYTQEGQEVRRRLDRNIMSVIVAADEGTTIETFNSMSAQERAAAFTRGATRISAMTENAEQLPELTNVPGAQTQQPTQKKNWFDKIMDFVKKVLSILGLYYAFTNLLSLIGMKSSTDEEVRQFEQRSKSFYYTMNALNQSWDNLDRELDNWGGGSGGSGGGDTDFDEPPPSPPPAGPM
ncbi:hypothetical protein DRN67_01825 [Candidatus Micrarchaeota archaeon]|nr:MAG: hypothetical protein DRN67_01825 [Candidatus Micrarchaeota archaeon]